MTTSFKNYLGYIPILIILSSCQVSDFNGTKDKLLYTVKDFVHRFGSNKNIINSPNYDLPIIPNLESKATSTKIYETEIKKKNQNIVINESYQVSFIKEIYKTVLNRDPYRNEFNNWLNALKQNATREGMYNSITNSNAYRVLLNNPFPPRENVVEFSNKFLNDFLGLTANLNVLSKSNFYTLKKYLCDKTLELLDSYIYQNEEKNVYLWYSVFSYHLSTYYPNTWENPFRKNNFDKVHYKWAEGVSYDIIKSETIIKIHKIMNSLQFSKGN